MKRCVECDRQLDKLGCANNRCIEYWRVVVERQGIGYRAEAEQLRTDLAAARAENVRVEARRDALIGELAIEKKRADDATWKLAMLQTSVPNVWMYQGDGGDLPESLTAPVVMSSDTLRQMLAENAALVEAVGWAVSRLGLIADVAEKHDPNEHRLAIGACSAIANHLRAALAKVRP